MLLLIRRLGCPHAMQVGIALRLKGMAFETSEPIAPTWLVDRDVSIAEPVLTTGEEVVLGSGAILSMLDELHPDRPLRHAESDREQPWVLLSEHLLDQVRAMLAADAPREFLTARGRLVLGLDHLSTQVRNGTLTGTAFGFADLLVAPTMCYVTAFRGVGIFGAANLDARVAEYAAFVVRHACVAGAFDFTLDDLVGTGMTGDYFRDLFRELCSTSGMRRKAELADTIEQEGEDPTGT